MILHIAAVTGFLCFAAPISLASVIAETQNQAFCDAANEVACSDGTCIPRERLCDGARDCLDGKDESGCLTNPIHDISPGPDYLIHRSRRQASNCGKLQWQCRNGQCISFDGKCDGVVDCDDGSDETHALCRGLKCQSFWFRCTYGACVDGDAVCNGRTECADNSDEIGPQCLKEPDVVNNQFHCADGTLIPSSDKCDGRANCPDASDETVRACGNITCSSHFFQCAYGACVDQGSDCNGVSDCQDDSDEKEELCGTTTKPQSSDGKKCKLPPYPNNGRYTVEGWPSARPTQELDVATIHVICNKNYALKGIKTEFNCIKGRWTYGLTVPSECVRTCRLDLNLPDLEYKDCLFPDDDRSSQCTTSVPSGTIVQTPECRPPNYYSERSRLTEMTCIDGQWDYKPTCLPECGQVTPEGMQLVVNGVTAKHGELPWHAAIYDKSFKPRKQICGGSIITNKLVISAAHCFWSAPEKRTLPGVTFSVAAGKIYKPWDETHDAEAQKSEVERLYSHPSFFSQDNNFANDIALLLLATPFVYRPYIRPVCIRFDDRFESKQLIGGQPGKIAGWGYTSADGKVTGTLQTTTLPFIPEAECSRRAPVEFRPFIVSDKICAGYDNGTSTVCQGDSGGGLVFPNDDFGVQRYYLRGIVSTSPQSTTKCNVNAIVTFTRVSAHEDMILRIMRESSST